MEKLSVAVLVAVLASTAFFPELWGAEQQTVHLTTPTTIVDGDTTHIVVHGNAPRVDVVEERVGFFGNWKKETTYLLPAGTKPSVSGLPGKSVIDWTM